MKVDNSGEEMTQFPKSEALLRSPVILVGAGRSGTTLLQSMLAAHSQIAMLGEFGFSTLDLWRAFWTTDAAEKERARRFSQRYPAADRRLPGPGDEAILMRARDFERSEKRRAASLLHGTMDRFYGLSERGRRRWGFKEIWLRGRAGHNWVAFDNLYPDAFYVQILRDPFAFARSSAAWNRVDLTENMLADMLQLWVDCLVWNQARSETGRYFRLRYEDLAEDPRSAMELLLAAIDLPFEENCLVPMFVQHLPSKRNMPLPENFAAVAARITGLAPLMREFGYGMPSDRDRRPGELEHSIEVGSPIVGKWDRWLLNPPYLENGGFGWQARLAMSSLLAPLALVADDLEHPKRSPLHLYENGNALGPAHSVHRAIREVGGGRYSHWGPDHSLLFSTSDNSDPNTNGRVYVIVVPGIAKVSETDFPLGRNLSARPLGDDLNPYDSVRGEAVEEGQPPTDPDIRIIRSEPLPEG